VPPGLSAELRRAARTPRENPPAYPHVRRACAGCFPRVGVMGNLVSVDLREGYADKTARNKSAPGKKHQSRKAQPLLSLADARARGPAYDWSAYTPPRPSFLGHSRYNPVPLTKSFPTLNWTPFFHAWECAAFIQNIRARKGRPQGEELFDDGRKLLRSYLRERCSSAAP